jgi:hypothetical protein
LSLDALYISSCPTKTPPCRPHQKKGKAMEALPYKKAKEVITSLSRPIISDRNLQRS